MQGLVLRSSRLALRYLRANGILDADGRNDDHGPVFMVRSVRELAPELLVFIAKISNFAIRNPQFEIPQRSPIYSKASKLISSFGGVFSPKSSKDSIILSIRMFNGSLLDSSRRR